MKRCKFSRSAVISSDKREVVNIFNYIHQKSNLQVCICDKAIYRITNSSGKDFLLRDLKCIKLDHNGGYYVIDTFSSKRVYLKASNFKILCTSVEEYNQCHADEYVKKYPN